MAAFVVLFVVSFLAYSSLFSTKHSPSAWKNLAKVVDVHVNMG